MKYINDDMVSMPKLWMDKIISEVKTLSELKVIFFILRHTFGNGVSFCSISINQFMNGFGEEDAHSTGIGLARQHIIRGLAGAEEKGIILVYKNVMNGKQKKWYFINTPENARIVNALREKNITINDLIGSHRSNSFVRENEHINFMKQE